ncbi:unnamed protein product [Chrysoparadoxa australica]
MKLTEVRLDNNQLAGLLPKGLFANATSLTEVQLYNNNFTGQVPEDLFKNLTKLAYVDLIGNRVWGSFWLLCEAGTSRKNCVNVTGGDMEEEEETQQTFEHWERWYVGLCSLLWLLPLILLIPVWITKGVRDGKAEWAKYFIYVTIGVIIITLSNDGEESVPRTIDYAKLEPAVRLDVDVYAWNWTGYDAVHNLARRNAESKSCTVNIPSADGKKEIMSTPGKKYANCTSSCELSSFSRTVTCRFTSEGPPAGQPEEIWSFIEDGAGSVAEAERLSKLHTESCARELPSHMAAVTDCRVRCEEVNTFHAHCWVELHHTKQGHSTSVQTYGSEVFNFDLLKELAAVIDSNKNQALKTNYTNALNKAACKGVANCEAKQCTGFTEETMNCQVSKVTTRSIQHWIIWVVTSVHMLLWWLVVVLRLGGIPPCSGGSGLEVPQDGVCLRGYEVNEVWHYRIEGSKHEVKQRKILWEPFEDDIRASWDCCSEGDRALVYFWDDEAKAYGVPGLAVSQQEGGPEEGKRNGSSYLEMVVDPANKDSDDPIYHICLIGIGKDTKAAEVVENVLITRQRAVGMVLVRSEGQWYDARTQLGQYYLLGLESEPPPSDELLDFWHGYSVADCAGASLLASAIAGATWVSGSEVFTTVFTILAGTSMEQELSVLNILWLWPNTWITSYGHTDWMRLRGVTKWLSSGGLGTSNITYRVVVVLLAAPAVILELNQEWGRWVTLVIYLSGSFILWVYALGWLLFSKAAFGCASLTPAGACDDKEDKLPQAMARIAGQEWFPALLLADLSKAICCTMQNTSDKGGPLLVDVEARSCSRRPDEQPQCAYCRLNVNQVDVLQSSSPQDTASDQGDASTPLLRAPSR